jgi:putative transposon-encoded protein
MKYIISTTKIKTKPENTFIRRVVKSGNGAAISFLKRYIGKEVYIIIKEAKKEECEDDDVPEEERVIKPKGKVKSSKRA